MAYIKLSNTQIYPPSSPRRARGFTLIELLVAVSILVIMVTVGVPNFVSFVQSYSAQSAMSMFHKDLQLARAEAVSLGKRVTVCHLGSDDSCDGDWLEGVSVFVDDGATIGELDDGELVLAQSNAMGSENSFQDSSRTRVTFTADGQSAGFAATFVFCPSSGEAQYARGVILSNTGRARSTSDSNDDGTHEDADGDALTCS